MNTTKKFHFGFKRLTAKMIALIGGLSLIICVGLSFTTYIVGKNEMSVVVEEALSKITAEGADKITEHINGYYQGLNTLACDSLFQDMKTNKTEIIALMKRVATAEGHSNMFVADANGDVYTMEDKTTNIADRDYFKIAIKGENAISDPLENKTSKVLETFVAAPIKNAAGQTIGILAICRDAMDLSTLVTGITYAKSGKAFMMNKTGTTVAHTNMDLVIARDNDFENIKKDPGLASLVALETKMAAGETGVGQYSYGGVQKYMGFHPVEGTQWSIALAAPESEVFAAVTQMATTTVGFSIGFILASIIISFLIALTLANPVKKCLVMLQEMSKGHFSTRMKVKTKDEIGQMMDTMNHFTDYLQTDVIGVMQQIAAGDVSARVVPADDKDEIAPALASTIGAVRALVNDANMLATAAIEGRLSTRADVSRHKGEYANVVDGVNKTLDAVINPVQEASNVLNKMAEGNLKVRMTGNYNGDLNVIKLDMNRTLDTLEGYVGEISGTLTEMANSNMAVSINRDYKGDFNPIKDALNLIIDSFNQILYDMNNAADQVASGSKQVSDGSQELSQGATEQAGAIEELTTSIGDIAGKTKQNAMRANEASELAAAAKEKAEQGNIQMQALQKAMEEINQSSANISKIIKVIDDIAFQTNILALNAAVEAARAGQHGKGFAVVAEEVRNLAARSANAANETTALIEGSIKKVGAGTAIADGTAKALEQIVIEVSKAATLVVGIAEASNEQASNITQINQGVEQVSQVVQSNSATAEESAAASEELSSQAELLKEMIGQFQLKTDHRKNRA